MQNHKDNEASNALVSLYATTSIYIKANNAYSTRGKILYTAGSRQSLARVFASIPSPHLLHAVAKKDPLRVDTGEQV